MVSQDSQAKRPEPGRVGVEGPPAPSAVAEELEGPPLPGSPLGVWGVSPRTHTGAPGPEQ